MGIIFSSFNGLEPLPKLRFLEFKNTYKKTKLNEAVERIQRRDPTSEAPVMMLSAASGFIMQSEKYSRENAGQSLKKYILLRKGELAYNHGASKYKPFGCCFELKEDEARIPYVYHCFAVKENNDKSYIARLLNNQKIDQQLKRLISSSVRMDGLLNISYEEYTGIDLYLPSLLEQQKIADFLFLVDRRIEKQRQLVESLKKYKRGLVFHLFNKNNPINKSIPMRDLLTEINDRNSVGLRVCSVAVIKGIVDQIEHLGRSFSASDTSKYRRVHFGDVVYTKSPTGDFPFGIVKQSKIKEDVAVSPLYGVYKPSSYSTGNLLHLYFEQYQYANNYIRSLAQKGAKNTINITTQHFLEKNIIFPYNEVDRVYFSNFFEKLNKLIKFNEGELEKAQSLKKGLLQQMFI